MGSSSINAELLQMEKDAVAKRERDDREKEERLKSGRAQIEAMFSRGGGSYTTPATYSNELVNPNAAKTYQKWNSYDTSNDTFLAKPGTQPYRPAYYDVRTNTFNPATGGSSGGSQGYGNTSRYETVANPEYGKRHDVWTEGETKTQSGLGDSFYDNFKNSILDFQQPEVERQFTEAKSQNLFDLARRGLLRSTQAAENAGNLTREKSEADARVISDAENQTSGLQGDVAAAQQNAISLLQQTEDPTTAANTAQREINAINSRSPQFNDLGSLFTAGLNAAANYQTAQTAKKAYDSIPGNDPYASQGRNY